MKFYAQSMGNQAENRQYVEFTDQHGRIWGAQTENKNRHPVGAVLPKFYAPWYPDPIYFRYDTKRQNDVMIDYNALIRQDADAQAQFVALCHKAAVRFNVLNWDPAAGPTPQMKHDIGPAPLPLGEFAKAAKAANGFILGFRPYDAAQPGDVKLQGFLDRVEAYYRQVRGVVEGDGAEYADEAPMAGVLEPRRRPGRPTNAELAARRAAEGREE